MTAVDAAGHWRESLQRVGARGEVKGGIRRVEPVDRIIIGTAGHIDHGKTTLIRRLTGVDTDRLPEEKKRGITIVLGFAPLALNDGRTVGVVDVPGHERFVKNMVAGAGGIDLALLVVAADEGVMPQTREHLEICELLGVRGGVVALTKIDRAGDLLELALEDVRSELKATFLENAPIMPCSAVTGEGIEELRVALSDALSHHQPRSTEGAAFLPIDRTFSMKGFGSVVTGTLLRGRLRVGSAMSLVPQIPGRSVEEVRIRGIQTFSEKVETAESGRRTAVNLQGVELDAVRMGQALVTPGSAVPTRRLTARLRYLSSRPRALKTGAKAILHVGTALVECGITLLENDGLEPGASEVVTMRLAEPVAAAPGLRFILRGFEATASAGRTIGGGLILDPEPGMRRRKRPETIEVLKRLEALLQDGPDEDRLKDAAMALVEEAGPGGVTGPALCRRLGVTAKALEKETKKAKGVVWAGERAVGAGRLSELMKRLLSAVNAYHDEFPYRPGASVKELSSKLGRRVPEPVVNLAAQRAVNAKHLLREQSLLRAPSHRPRAEANPEVRERILSALREGGLTPPTAPELERELNLPPKSFRELMAALTRTGELVHIAPKIYYDKAAFESAAACVLTEARQNEGISTQRAKQLLDIPRKYLIPLLETLDKQGLTAFDGEVRRARN